MQCVWIHCFGLAIGLFDATVGHLVNHLETGKDTGECVVVLLSDRIELVVMAARAGDGQTEHGARDRNNTVFPFVGHYVDAIAIVVLWPQAEKSERCQVLRLSTVNLVGSKL